MVTTWGRDIFNQNFRKFWSKTQRIGVVQPELSFEKTGPPFEVDHFSRSDRSEILVEWIALSEKWSQTFFHPAPPAPPLPSRNYTHFLDEGYSSVVEPGEGPGGPPLLFIGQTEAPRAEKNFFNPPPHLSQGLDDRAPPVSEGLDQPL